MHALGISHVYCSPLLEGAGGSMHGYDVVAHQGVNEELGGAEGHERLCRKLGEAKMGQVLDVVPNHMSLGKENRYWWEVLDNGRSSRYASFFDIDWQPMEERLRDKVLVPILGDQYGKVLQAGGIKVTRRENKFQVECSGETLPASPNSLAAILARASEYARSDTLSFVAASFGRLLQPEYVDRRTILARHRDKVVLFNLLERLCGEESGIWEAIDQSVAELNGNLDALDDFLNQQNYRLAYWKTADQQLSYRRVFVLKKRRGPRGGGGGVVGGKKMRGVGRRGRRVGWWLAGWRLVWVSRVVGGPLAGADCIGIDRTCVVRERDEIREEDREEITQATECAKQQRLDIDADLFDFLRDVLTMEVKGRQESEFVLRFQQFTGPVMAKGVEDTAFYCYNRLTGMNEVGSDPGRNGLSVGEFHAYCAKMQQTHPLTMTTLSTHDTKRSDDVKARMAVLSATPARCTSAIQRRAPVT